MEKQKYFITTPIYYPSGKWHLGHCYTTVCCDSLARFKRLEGFDVFYLTGTDEHGQKIERRALESNMEPKAFVDGLVEELKRLWGVLHISYDKYIRTTDAEHIACVQKIFTKLFEQGDIYKDNYTGLYCTPCESFWTTSQLIDGDKCPDCGRPVQPMEEEAYFFRLSKYADKVGELLRTTDFLRPEFRVTEMLNNFIDKGTTDLCVSRTSFSWGVQIPFDDRHIVYVWLDALVNYLSAMGYLSEDDSNFQKFWPPDMQVMAKEIVRFHSIVWPAALTALDLPLPKNIFAHGWIMLDGDKMSKSKGNVVDPFVLIEKFGVDAIRYYTLTCLPYGSDGQYNTEMLINKINTDLVNTLGNLVSRTVAMVEQYRGGVVPAPAAETPFDAELCAASQKLLGQINGFLSEMKVALAAESIIAFAEVCNKYIDNTAPWTLAKDAQKKDTLDTVLYNLIESIRVLGVALQPFMVETPQKIFDMLGITDGALKSLGSIKKFGAYKPGTAVKKGESLFPRIDKVTALKEFSDAEALRGTPVQKVK